MIFNFLLPIRTIYSQPMFLKAEIAYYYYLDIIKNRKRKENVCKNIYNFNYIYCLVMFFTIIFYIYVLMIG